MKTRNSNLKPSTTTSAGTKKGQRPNSGPRSILRRGNLTRFGIPLLFFGSCFVFVLFYIDPAVIYASNGINIHNSVAATHVKEASPQDTSLIADPSYRRLFILELTPEYLREIAGTPGGWTRLAVTLCIYVCHYPFAGALAITALALFFYWIFPLYLQGACLIRPFFLRFIPALFILTMCAWYELSYFVFLLPVAGALAFTVFYQRFRPDGAMARVLLMSLLFWSAWYLFQWGCLLVLPFAAIHEWFNRERRIASFAIASSVDCALLFALDAWFIPFSMTIRWRDFMVPHGLPLVMIGFFPLAATLLAVLGRMRHMPEGKTTAIGAIVQTSLLVCGTVAAAVWLCRDPVNRDTRTLARTVYHVMNEQWDAVLHEKTAALFADFPRKSGALQAFMVHAVDHALCRTGRLGDRLFAFPQAVFSYDPLLMLHTTLHSNGYVNWVVVLDLAMDLGMVNTAEKIAGEIMENMGPYPDVIYRRALVQIAKGNNDAAAVYLNKLACMPFYRAEAKRLLNMLDNSAALLSEPWIDAMHANRDTVDYFLYTVSYDAMLKHLLESNNGNKAAYDYLMTFCLLTGGLDGVASLAPAAPVFGYTVLPRCWEEALCVFRAANSQQAPSGASFSGLRPETVERFNEFAQAYSMQKDDITGAANLAPAFGDSYFYFSIFRHSPGARHE
jgi:hypothetical protein